MNKMPCDVIKDLLPLYEDGVCSEQSRAVIEEHLSECEDCKKLYMAMQEKLPDIKDSADNRAEQADIKFLKKIRRKYAGHQVIIGGIILLIIVIITALPSILNLDPYVPPLQLIDHRVPVDEVHVKEVYEMENGDIYFALKFDKGFTRYTLPEISKPDYNYFDDWSTGCHEFSAMSYWWDKFSNSSVVMDEWYCVVPLKQDVYLDTDYNGTKERHIARTSEAIYYVGRDNEKITIWEKGQKLTKAPSEIEAEAKVDGRSVDFPHDGEPGTYRVVSWDNFEERMGMKLEEK